MTADRILNWKPAAIVFDCDGTLMDSERHWVAAREIVLREYGTTPDEAFAERTRGVHYTECGRLMAEFADVPALADQITEQLLDQFRKLVVDDPVTKPGALELVRRTSAFAPLAVASNCPRDVVESGLAQAGMLQYIGHVVVPEEDMRPKPAPDVYAYACLKCGVPPEQALAVEDSHCGVVSAAAAGLRVLGVGPRPSSETLALTDLWVDSLADARLTAWADRRAP